MPANRRRGGGEDRCVQRWRVGRRRGSGSLVVAVPPGAPYQCRLCFLWGAATAPAGAKPSASPRSVEGASLPEFPSGPCPYLHRQDSPGLLTKASLLLETLFLQEPLRRERSPPHPWQPLGMRKPSEARWVEPRGPLYSAGGRWPAARAQGHPKMMDSLVLQRRDC